MKQKFIRVGLLLALSVGILPISAQQISPTPQNILNTNNGQTISIPESYTIIADKDNQSTLAINKLKSAFSKTATKAPFQIIIGTKGEKSVQKYVKRIPQRAEGYYLAIEKKRIIIAGADPQGTFYGVQSLLQLVDNGKLKTCEVTDFPDIDYRGVVEGFYGTPWSHEARLRQIEFYGKNKMNVYIYGPKDDPYHSVPNWRKPYPKEEAAQLKQLVDKSHENGVIFYWAIHPGGDIKWNDTDRDLLMKKFESMYELGVRAFAVFFDDISGEGTKADRQAELLNYIDNNFIQKKKGMAPLVMCPTEYNKSWSNVKGGYLTTLGEKLNKDIQIMWTGDRVIACIDKPTMDWINPLIKRKAYIWWNFPVSDYVRDHLLLGPVYGNTKDIKNDMSGFVSNPMERAEASKIALYSVADYSWNVEGFDSDGSWDRALKDLLPNAYPYLKIFAEHNSDLGRNGHGFRRDESVALQPVLKTLIDEYKQDRIATNEINKLSTTCNNICEAADILLVDNQNRPFIQEIEPWLHQFKLVGEYGKDIQKMINARKENNRTAFETTHRHAKALLMQMYNNDAASNQNPYQPGIKTCSKVLLPTLNELFELATTYYNKENGTKLDTKAEYNPFTLESSVPQLALLPVQYKGNNANVSPSNEVIKWAAGASVTVSMDYARKLTGLNFDLGKEDIVKAFRCEISTNGTDWENVELTQQAGKNQIGTTPAINGKTVLKIRLTNSSGKEQEVYFKQFRFSTINQ